MASQQHNAAESLPETSFFRQAVEERQQLDAAILGEESMPSSPELASASSSDSIASLGTPDSPSLDDPLAGPPVADSFVFAFDIDGVLVRGGRPLPEAIEAMKVLNGENKYGIQV